MKEKSISVAKAVLIALVILSGAIALPILFRPFFWWHIGPLELPAFTGLSVAQIKTAYGEMLDYCVGLKDTFSVGVLPFSESGAAHFADVRKLFLLDLWVLVISATALMALHIWKPRTVRLAGHMPGFWSAVGLGAAFVTLGGLVALNFERAFMVFHKLFFPGKADWQFDSRVDPVIGMLPEGFFRNCAILILAVILISCTALLILDRKMYHRRGDH